jgi:predicted type IV restriction endonuclease
MDFKDIIKQLGERVSRLKEQIQTEEATKNAFIMPFIQALGYDVFNPLEVMPEFTSDIGIKKGEKVDYAILKDTVPVILIECKWWGTNLNLFDSQLLRYFHTSKAKFGLLSNGIQFRFYTDLVEANKMDEKPFLEFDITNIKEQQINELKKFHKSYFDINAIFSSASELKYMNEIKSILGVQFNTPSEEFVRYFVSSVYQGRATEKVLTQFTEIVKKSYTQFINDVISERLKTALQQENQKEEEQAKLESELQKDDSGIITTQEELEAYFIVKSILHNTLDSSRIFYRDFPNTFAVLVDDSIRQLICKFYFNKENKKEIGLIDESKKEQRFEIKTLDDIYTYSDRLCNTAKKFIKP